MRKFDGVSHSINIRRRSLKIVVHPDASRLADPESGCFGQSRFGTDADRKDNQVGRDTLPACEKDLDFVVPFFEAFDALLQIKVHPFL